MGLGGPVPTAVNSVGPEGTGGTSRDMGLRGDFDLLAWPAAPVL